MLEVIGGIAVFILSFLFSGIAAVFFTGKYWGSSYVQLFLGYWGAAMFSTGLSASLLEFSFYISVVLAAGVSAALTGVGAGLYLLDLDWDWSFPSGLPDEAKQVEKGYSDDDLAVGGGVVREKPYSEEEER